MAEMDKRIITLEIEVAGGKKRLEGLSVEYSVSKTAGGRMNEAEIRVANLAGEDRDYLVTATSPLQRPRQRKSVSIWAGYAETGLTRRFKGDIVSAGVTQPPDVWLILKAMTGYFSRGEIIAQEGPEVSRLSALAGQIAQKLGLGLQFEAQDKNIANYSFTGASLAQVDKLALAGLVDAYVDDDLLVVKDRGRGLAGRARALSQDSGLVGIPEVTETGVRARMLMDPFTAVGSTLKITSRLNPAANGSFTVYKLRDNCALRNTQFYLEAEALRPGLGGLPV
jgi:hypothetical protein